MLFWYVASIGINWMHAKIYFNALCLYVRTKNGRRKINTLIFSRNCLIFHTGFTLQYWHHSFALEIIGGLFFRSYQRQY